MNVHVCDRVCSAQRLTSWRSAARHMANQLKATSRFAPVAFFSLPLSSFAPSHLHARQVIQHHPPLLLLRPCMIFCHVVLLVYLYSYLLLILCPSLSRLISNLCRHLCQLPLLSRAFCRIKLLWSRLRTARRPPPTAPLWPHLLMHSRQPH